MHRDNPQTRFSSGLYLWQANGESDTIQGADMLPKRFFTVLAAFTAMRM
jgi:hypothetical protein